MKNNTDDRWGENDESNWTTDILRVPPSLWI